MIIRKPFAIMLAQLKTFVLIKEAIKLAFFRLVEYLEHQHLWVWLQAQNGQKRRPFFRKLSVYSCSEKWGNSMREISKKFKISYNAVYYSLHRTEQTSPNQNRKRSGRPRCTTEQENKYIRVSSLRNRRITSPQLAASLNITRKHQSQRHRDAGLLGRVPLSSLCVLLPIFSFYSPVWDMYFSLQLFLEGQHPGVASSLLTLRLVFCGYYLIMKLLVEDLWCVCFSN